MKALDLAKYIIKEAVMIEKPVSNLQLQKILYFINGEYYKKYNEFLIKEEFYAYPLGPVNMESYRLYQFFGSSKIDGASEQNAEIDNEFDINLINEKIEEYSSFSAWDIVNLSHKPTGAWYKTKEEKGMYSIIDTKLVEEEFGVS